ncbi:UNVERIFIED_CONTAM: hypothetical protein Slati_4037100 [Sesamum latifolium]|uniref:Uncharacterized protein n=1 Tax=Sesamum latifolium TaxID=2727402 RepID=A0AAW2TRN4_9LAMI
MEDPQPLPQILSPCSSGRRRSSADSSSPEFEFWMVRNPSFPQPNLLSADELFSDGVLLPLHHLLHVSNELPPPPQDSQAPGSDQVTEPEPSRVELGDQSATSTALSTSRRWRYIFKKSDKKVLESSVGVSADDHATCKEKDVRVKDKKRDQKKNGGGAGAATSNLVSATELNINIWPFSRSRSAGNGGTRPRWATATRKASSAPCSRSNSTGESKSRKWPNSPSRAGVHLGRSSPVWQVRRGNGGVGRSSETVARNSEKGARKEAGTEGRRKPPAASSGGGGPKARVLSLNVPMCIGYRHNMSCRNDENSTVSVAAADGGGRGASGEGVRRSNLFNIRSLFTKKVY